MTANPKEETILELLAEHGELYGLDLVRLSRGRLKRGTVYVVLARMEDNGIVAARSVDSQHTGGIPRRLYRLTSGEVAR